MSGEELELLRELFEMHSIWREQPLSQRREYYERADAAFGGPGAAPGETVVVQECSAEWVLPFRPGGPVLLYFHGGSYTMGSAASHRHLVRELGEVCGGSALSVDYRRAPEAPFPAAVTDAVACYRYLLDRGVPSHRIILAGDSAGAGVTVATMLALREAGVPQPAAGLCISPWADLTCGSDSHRTRAARDPVLDSADLRRMAALYHAGTRLYVLDDRQRPVPDGQPGELVIAGLPVARGYLGRPELTAQVFLDDPYGPPGERMYRTGDRALRRPDGAFEYLGRLDDQVKLRGQRIELGEVEACLQSHPAVGRAVVALKSRGEADQRLVGYLLPTPGQDSDLVVAAVRAHVRERLPDYMVPAAFVVVDRIPLSPSGKVDRRALPDPAPAGREHRQPPRPGIEAEVAARWTQVLGCAAPDRRDRFLDSGGNSLLATVLAARLSHELGRPVTVARIIGAGSLAELAAAVNGTPIAGAETFAFPTARSLDEQRLDRVATMSADELDALLEDLEEVG